MHGDVINVGNGKKRGSIFAWLRINEFAAWLGDGATEGLGGFDPFGDNGLGVGDGFFVGGTVGHAAGEFGDFDDEARVSFAPVDDEFVAHVV
jgi:hypothetical protein